MQFTYDDYVGALVSRDTGAPPDCLVRGVVVAVPRERGFDQVVAVERAGGLLHMPGGKVEAGEILAAAALRELREETGCPAYTPGLLSLLGYVDLRGQDGVVAFYVSPFALVNDRASEFLPNPMAAEPGRNPRWERLAVLCGPELGKFSIGARFVRSTFER